MTKDSFFANFGYLADAPNGVKKLRELILQLAVQGKLVPHDPNDEPASILLAKIKAEKEQLVKEKKIKKAEPLPAVSSDEIPYELPKGWEWVRLPDITHDCGQKIPDVEFVYIDVSAIDNKIGAVTDEVTIIQPNDAPSRARKLVRLGSVIYSTVRPYLLNIAVIDKEFQPAPIVSTAFAVLHPYEGIVGKFLFHYLRSRPFIDYVEVAMTGMAYPAINDTRLRMGVVPVPPCAEQNRIVTKVDHLLRLCDKLEKRQQKKNKKLVNLNNAALNQLFIARETDDFANAWCLIRDNFDFLYTAPETIGKLRQGILQLAVMGKLVPQDPNDEPASVLLKKIAGEKARLIKEGKIKNQKPLPEISEEEKPFELPPGMEWARLQRLVFLLGDGLHGTPNFTPGTSYYFINGNNLNNGRIDIKPSTKTVSLEEMLKHKKYLSPDAVLVSINGTLGNVAFYSGEEIILGKSACYFNLSEYVSKHFIRIVIESVYFMSYALRKATGSTIKNLSLDAMNNFPVPLPPLAEQHRIVAKVDQLVKLCDELEAKLIKSQTKSEKLVEASVKAIGAG